jgi:sulfur-carrier protein adenylyltransferase/sulfurtransferase
MQTITVLDLKKRLDAKEPLFLLDVREDHEVQRSPMKGQAVHHIPLGQLPTRVAELPKDGTIVCLCRSGGRSQMAQNWLADQGFARTLNLIGGMQAWARDVDPSITVV